MEKDPGSYAPYHLNPEVWFRDVVGNWFLIAKSFTEYYRLLMVHMGVPRWQYAYTDIGLDPVTTFWLGFMNPHRLEIDMKRDHVAVYEQWL